MLLRGGHIKISWWKGICQIWKRNPGNFNTWPPVSPGVTPQLWYVFIYLFITYTLCPAPPIIPHNSLEGEDFILFIILPPAPRTLLALGRCSIDIFLNEGKNHWTISLSRAGRFLNNTVYLRGQEHGVGGVENLDGILTLLFLICYISWAELLNHSQAQFPQL